MENFRVGIAFLATMLGCWVLACLIAERPLSISLVDHDCEQAQEQYYRSRERSLGYQTLNPTREDQESTEKREHADVCSQNLMAKAAEKGLWALGATLVFTAFAAVMAWRTVQTMEATAKQQLRAYVSVVASGAGQREDGRIEFRVKIKNSGQTPAYKLDARIGTKLAECPIVTVPPWPDRIDTYETTLGPGADDDMIIVRKTLISDDDQAQLIMRTKAVYVLGRIEYEDIFRRPQYTDFRLMYFGEPGQGLKRAPNGNDAS